MTEPGRNGRLRIPRKNIRRNDMSKVAVVYWSGTGNTEAMANAVAEGIRSKASDAVMLGPSEFSAGDVANYDAIAFGCPSMGAEVLEEEEFEPMFAAVLPALAGKKVGLFGSWGWGGGAWMLDWEQRCRDAGVALVSDGVTCQEYPDADAVAACKALGASLA